MNYTQNERIKQVHEKTLVIGVDIAKKDHYARAFDFRGVELGRVLRFKANGFGFKNFLDWATEISKKHGKENTIVGIEPTGHYWYTFAETVLAEGMLLVQVNPLHVKKAKELDDGTPSKNDKKDPRTIAMLIKDGRYQTPYLPKGVYAELRKSFEIREKKIKQRNRLKNLIQRWIDIYFPEFLEVFKNWEGKAALNTLANFPTPSMILELDAEEILEIWKKKVKRAVGIRRAELLIKVASKSVGSIRGHEMAIYDLKEDLEEYIRICEKMKELEKIIEELVLKIPGIVNIMSIKGVGLITAAGFIAEVGEISRFDSPKQIIKLAGLNVVSNSSGKHKGQGRIAKRGRAKLRALLFRVILPVVATNEAFNQLHRYNITLKEKPLKRMQSLIALCHKLIKIIYRLVINNEMYNPSKMLQDIHRGTTSQIIAA